MSRRWLPLRWPAMTAVAAMRWLRGACERSNFVGGGHDATVRKCPLAGHRARGRFGAGSMLCLETDVAASTSACRRLDLPESDVASSATLSQRARSSGQRWGSVAALCAGERLQDV